MHYTDGLYLVFTAPQHKRYLIVSLFSPLHSHPFSFSRLFLFNIFLFLFQVFCFIGTALFVLLGVFMVIFLMKDWNSKVVKATVKAAVTG